MKLYEWASLIRAKNAGPFMLTIDILFETEEALQHVHNSGILSAAFISNVYHVPEAQVESYLCEEAKAIKFSFPRPHAAGDFEDKDVFGGQYHAPLVNVEIPD
ncbi:DUF4387 domain-containing protein [Halalkalibacter oceani]|uniref:DUF4387 domain-containing protein n=1 Tax=Halalkalibacter oceani TaxID=1653776 RepID=UPI003391F934